jgi:hypothetical protein
MRYIRTLSGVTSERSLTVTQGPFLASAHRELSVALLQSQGDAPPLLAKASGRQALPGRDTPLIWRSVVPTVSVLWLGLSVDV